MIKNFLIGSLLLFVVTAPQFASAQSQTEDEYRDYLLNIIALLQQQVELLLESQQDGFTLENNLDADFDSFLIADEDDIEARYLIDDPNQVLNIENSDHQNFFTRFFDLVPDKYDGYIIDLLVYEENDNDFDGFVETVPPYRSDTWRLGISESMFEFNVAEITVSELFVHEFAHIVSYEAIAGVAASQSSDCHDYYDGFDCPPSNSYFKAFADAFWPDDVLDDFAEEGDLLWSDRELRDDFITDYAATAPGEDFAESFTNFVLNAKPSGSKLKYDKVRFFYDYDHLVDLREEIRSEL